ncbi:hypothetical protein [Sphingobium sp. Cam5-1]|uniref:hypothetical protein n=1 Tax=Sphingobium sp. Cam5-1 TaxID=2789327 RepID=UPI0018AD20F2|nr:hypothetical protein [Sphingobium sp. Cam5-1]QPI72377.1 hypothetical protein IZV00_10855 [Sphingobium sp. Cam5-1]
MSRKENPTTKGRGSRVSFGDWTQDALTLSAYRAQHLIGSYGVRPEQAVMLTALAFGGHGHG